MGELRKQDKEAGLQIIRLGERRLAAFDPVIMLKVLEQVADGALLKDIVLQPGMPSKLTILQWVMTVPEAARAWRAARELSAMSLEEEAIGLGRKIAAEPGLSKQARAFEIAMNQLRWSASRRDPSKFGEQRQTQVVVPVQIITSLNMGAGEGPSVGTDEFPNIYEVEAKLEVAEGDPIPEGAQPVTPVEEQEPDKPMIPTGRERMGRKGPRKTVLTPRGEPDRSKLDKKQPDRRLKNAG